MKQTEKSRYRGRKSERLKQAKEKWKATADKQRVRAQDAERRRNYSLAKDPAVKAEIERLLESHKHGGVVVAVRLHPGGNVVFWRSGAALRKQNWRAGCKAQFRVKVAGKQRVVVVRSDQLHFGPEPEMKLFSAAKLAKWEKFRDRIQRGPRKRCAILTPQNKFHIVST